MSALWQVYDGIASKANAEVVSVAWEREEGKVFRYDLPVPKCLDPQAAKFVSAVVERIAKFVVWSAGGCSPSDPLACPKGKPNAKIGVLSDVHVNAGRLEAALAPFRRALEYFRDGGRTPC